MQKPSQQSPVKSRQIKLRASCDTCFLAKVKCSKARPVCSRCLACGAECNYSPSCRAGKRKSLLRKADRHITLEGIHVRPNHASKDTIKPNRKGTVWSRETQDTWVVPDPTFGISGGLLEHEISSFVTSIPLYHEVSAETEGSRVNDDFFNPFLGWISPTETDNTSTYFDHVDQSHSYRLSFPSVEKLGSEWATQKRYGPFPSPPPEIVSSPIINSSIGTQKAPACQCFNSCLETLQKLYDRQFGNLGTEPFLTENQDAIATCSKMLGCPTCATKGLSELQATILATIMSNLLSTFQNAWNNCLGTLHRKVHHHQPEHDGSCNTISEDTRWSQARNIARNLKNLEEVFFRFQQLLGRRGESNGGLSHAWVYQLDQCFQASFVGLGEYKDFLM